MVLRICEKCHKGIVGKSLILDGRFYHENCLVCAYCGQSAKYPFVSYRGRAYHTVCSPASGQKICAWCLHSIFGRYYKKGERYYHVDCYKNHIEKQCVICGQPIHGEYYKDSWGNYAHTSHDGKKTKYCYACHRLIKTPGMLLDEDHCLCEICTKTSVTTQEQVESCRRKVIAIFRELGITGMPENIPVNLVRLNKMRNARGRFHYKLRTHADPRSFSIDIIYGLPEVLFMGILAHEMLHSWLELYGRERTKAEEEGFCNLGTGFVYTRIDTPFSRFLLKREYENADEIYGEGYRLQKSRYERLGWAGLLESLRKKT